MKLTYKETVDRIELLAAQLSSGASNRGKILTELACLKRNIYKYPEYKESKKNERTSEET